MAGRRLSAVAYVRVSSDEQAELGVSLDAQAAKLRGYAVVKDLELVEVIDDPAVSGHTPLGQREGGRRLLELVQAGAVEHVLAVKLDRLFRNALNCLQLVEDWTRQGVGLHILDMGGNAVDTSSAMGKMFLTMAAGFAEMERNLIAERTRAALERKRERGERVGGRVPYGFELAPGGKLLVESAADKKLLARARRLQRAGMSIRAIAVKLASEGYVTRSGGPMTKSTVGNLLKGR